MIICIKTLYVLYKDYFVLKNLSRHRRMLRQLGKIKVHIRYSHGRLDTGRLVMGHFVVPETRKVTYNGGSALKRFC